MHTSEMPSQAFSVVISINNVQELSVNLEATHEPHYSNPINYGQLRAKDLPKVLDWDSNL